jgi:hypothetical protein
VLARPVVSTADSRLDKNGVPTTKSTSVWVPVKGGGGGPETGPLTLTLNPPSLLLDFEELLPVNRKGGVLVFHPLAQPISSRKHSKATLALFITGHTQFASPAAVCFASGCSMRTCFL